VVFVVLLASAHLELDYSACHFTKEQGFVSSLFVSSAKVRQEVFIESSFSFGYAVLFNLTMGNSVTDK
jgi:hypothetical protein